MSIKEYPFKTTASRIVWSCPWYQVRQDEIITPDGRPGIYNVIEKADAVWIVPVTTDGRVAMSRQYRYTVVQVIGSSSISVVSCMIHHTLA